MEKMRFQQSFSKTNCFLCRGQSCVPAETGRPSLARVRSVTPKSVRKQRTVVSSCAPREARAAPPMPRRKKYSSTKSIVRLKRNPRTMMVIAPTCRFSFLNIGASPQDKTWMTPPAIMILPYCSAAVSRLPEAPISFNSGVKNRRKHTVITAPAAKSARIVLALTRLDSSNFCSPCLMLI